MGCGASKESTETAVGNVAQSVRAANCNKSTSCALAAAKRNEEVAARSPSPAPRPQIGPSFRDSSSSPRPTSDSIATQLGSDVQSAATLDSGDFPAAAEFAEPGLDSSATAEVVDTAEVVETAQVLEAEILEPALDTSTAAGLIRAPSPPPEFQLCYSCQSVIEKLEERNVAVNINFTSTSSLLSARRQQLIRTPAPQPNVTDSRASTPKSTAASPAAEPIVAASQELLPPDDLVASAALAAESRASSRASSRAPSPRAPSPPSEVPAAEVPVVSQEKLEESANSTLRRLSSRTPSPAPRPLVCECRGSSPKITTLESRGLSLAPVLHSAAESKASSRAPSPAHADVESRASSPRQLLSSFRRHVSRSPSPAQIISQASRHSSPAVAVEIAKRHSSRSASPAPLPEVFKSQTVPADIAADSSSKNTSRASLASLKDSKSSPAVSERNGKVSPYAPSPAAGSRASSKSPALSTRASFGVGDEEGDLLSASAAAALKAIVQRVTSELAEKAVTHHDLVRDEEKKTSDTIPDQAKNEPEPGKEEKTDEILSTQSVEANKQSSATAAPAKLAGKGHSPRPGLYEYYLGLRSGEYNMSPPSSSASSQNDALAGIKDALDEIDITKDLMEENAAATAKLSSPTLDVESIYNEIRKLTFSEYEKLEQNDDSSSIEHETEMVSTTTKTQVLAEKEHVASPLSSKGSIEEGERLNHKLHELLTRMP
ncbi:flocculation protein FLO11 [Selaginella moellendorffii]|uniref:flocculation protein FLO11 n=1 Tax=Selaginella moellendorffii TaxID=88036 RepID=UPI000D1CA44E|nr:flocculation protein FLO11 [Selaginella moellendorffii]|eukprot:XP_024540232.1 flocculation protein FLO11 [Selaginella moellendorffii]